MGEYFKMDNAVKSEQSILSENIKYKNITCKRIILNSRKKLYADALFFLSYQKAAELH